MRTALIGKNSNVPATEVAMPAVHHIKYSGTVMTAAMQPVSVFIPQLARFKHCLLG
jgi:hypothetical protein